jgi:hypothetical protein
MAIFLEQIRVQNANTGDILRVEGNSIVPVSMISPQSSQTSLVSGDNIKLESNGLITASLYVVAADSAHGDEIHYTNEKVYANVAKLAVSSFRNDAGYATKFNIDRALAILDTTRVPEGDNLYYTDARVKAYLDQNIAPYTQDQVKHYISNCVSTSDITEGDNLYHTDARARAAFKAGDKISISTDGTIRAEATGSGLFNTDIDGSVGYGLTNALQVAVAFDSAAKVVLTMSPKLSESVIDNIKLAPGSCAELLVKPQVVKRGDKLKMQGFLAGIPTGGAVHACIVYESVEPGKYERAADTVPWRDQVAVYTSTGRASILESIKAVNVDAAAKAHAVTVTWNSPEGMIKGYVCKDFVIPANSSVEFCERPFRMAPGDTLAASASHVDAIALFVSAIRK